MIGKETIAALEARAAGFEARASSAEDPSTVLAEAREASTGMREELERDILASREAWLSQPTGLSVVETLRHLEVFNDEVAGDRAAIAKLRATMRRLNLRVDRMSYTTIDERITALKARGLPQEDATALAGATDVGGVVGLYRTYVGVQLVDDLQGLTLAAGTAGMRADPARVSAAFRALRRRSDMTEQTAALLAITPDSDAAYERFKSIRDSGLTPGVAAILAEPARGDARRVFDAMLASGDVDEVSAATIAAAAANADAPATRALKTYAAIREESDRSSAAVLAAASLASGKTADQLLAAHAHFAERGGLDADAAAAAWALDGVPGPAMASIINLLFQPA